MAIAFDSTYYLQQNPDVAAAISRGFFASAEDHYNQFGRFEGRDPNAYFDTSFYLSAYPDVAAAGVNPFQHFLTFGAMEDRFSNATAASLIDSDGNGFANEFDNAAYLAANPDVAAAVTAGTFKDGYQHFVQFGQFEARSGAQTTSGVVIEGSLASSGSLTLQGITAPATTETLNGTSQNDVILAPNGTLADGTTINGGAGNDTLIVRSAQTGNTTVNPTLRGVENVVISNTAASTFEYNASKSIGTTSFVSRDQAASSSTLITNIASGSSLALDNAKGATVFNVAGESARTGTADAITVNVANSGSAAAAATIAVVNATNTLPDATYETLNLNTSGATSSNIEVAFNNTTFTTVNVAGSAGLTLAGASGFANLTTVNASGLTGTAGLDIDVSNNAQNLTFTGSANNDVIRLGTSLTATDVINGGAGFDTVHVTTSGDLRSAAATAPFNALTSIEKVAFDGAGVTLDGVSFTNSTITNLEFNTVGADTINNAGSARTYEFGTANTGLSTFNMNASSTTINLALKGTADGVAALGGDITVALNSAAPAGSVATINLTSEGTLAAGTFNEVGTITAIAGSNVNISGAGNVQIAGFTNAANVNASSFTGVLDITGSATKDVITGGTGADIIHATVGGDTYTGGAGADTFIFTDVAQATSTALTTITDFVSGTDKLNVNGINGSGTAFNTTAIDTSSAADLAAALNLASTATTAGTTSYFQFRGDTYVVVDNTTASSTFQATDAVIKLTGLHSLVAADVVVA